MKYPLIIFILLPLALLNSHHLWSTFFTQDRSLFFIFVLWILPIIYFMVNLNKSKTKVNNKTILSIYFLAIFFGFLGWVVHLNILKDISLSLVLFSFIPISPQSLIWLLGAFFWFPSAGWILNKFSANEVWLKVLFTVFFTTPLLINLLRKKS